MPRPPAVKSVGTLVGGIGQFQARNRNAALLNKRGEQERINAGISGENRLRQVERSIGSAKARAGASGFTLSGSAADVIAQMQAEGSQGVASVIFDGAAQGKALDDQAKEERAAARLGLIGTAFDFGSTILTGASNFAAAKGP